MIHQISAADLVWIATATLTRQHPDRSGFSHEEIRRKVYELEPTSGFEDATIRTHITSHCVANKKPDPGKHRKLTQNPEGSYRLYRPGDAHHQGRADGKLLPDPNRIPQKYRELLDWYQAEYSQRVNREIQEDPILALAGVGKELWRDLGGGEKFIRELRESWEEPPVRVPESEPSAARQKKAI